MTNKDIIPIEVIDKRIYLIRREKVMLDFHLAELYGVGTKVLLQAVKRNLDRFPSDFMFQVTEQKFSILRSQIVTSRWGGRRYLPYAFTEQGVAMLSSVLRSKQAVQVNIQIMRAFVRLGKFLLAHKELAAKLRELETKYEEHDEQIKAIFEAIRRFLEPNGKPRRQIGFRVEEPRVLYHVKRRNKR